MHFDSLANLSRALEGAMGSTGPKGFTIIRMNGKVDSSEFLVVLWSQVNNYLKSHEHFSLEERKAGQKIVRRLEEITKQAEKTLPKMQSLWLKIFPWRNEARYLEDIARIDNLSPHVEEYLNSYTKTQLKELYPGQSLAEIGVDPHIAVSKSGGDWRYFL